MTKTENYNLNLWDATDPIRREDFNADNAAIDAALGNLNTAMEQVTVPQIVVGTYVGTASGASGTVEVDVGFRPKAVIAWGNYSNTPRSPTPMYSAMAVDCQNYSNALEITDSGFKAISYYNSMDGQYYPNLNENNRTYLYLAIG